MHTFGGIKILQHHLVPDEAPVIQMDPKCDPEGIWCTPEFRASVNKWLLDRFGTQPVAYILTKEQAMVMSFRVANMIDREIAKLLGVPS